MRCRDIGWVSDQVLRDGKCDGQRQRPVVDRDSGVCLFSANWYPQYPSDPLCKSLRPRQTRWIRLRWPPTIYSPAHLTSSRIIVYEVSLRFSNFFWNFLSPMHQTHISTGSEGGHGWRQKDRTLRRCFHLEGCSFTHCAGQNSTALWNTSFMRPESKNRLISLSTAKPPPHGFYRYDCG